MALFDQRVRGGNRARQSVATTKPANATSPERRSWQTTATRICGPLNGGGCWLRGSRTERNGNRGSMTFSAGLTKTFRYTMPPGCMRPSTPIWLGGLRWSSPSVRPASVLANRTFGAQDQEPVRTARPDTRRHHSLTTSTLLLVHHLGNPRGH